MATIADNALIINSPMDLEAEMCRYNCKTIEELEDTLWHEYGIILTVKYEHSL